MLFLLALSAVVAVAPPKGWEPIAEPSQKRLSCANHSRREWRVSTPQGELRIEPHDPTEDGAARALPFKPSPKLLPGGVSHVLAVKDGYFVGSDAGEWGGALFWFSAQGTQHRPLANENVQGIAQTGPDEVLSLHGLNHLSLREGRVRWFKPDAQGRWNLDEEKPLDSGPHTFTATPEAVYVMTATSLTKVGPGHQVTVLEPLPISQLYPNSLALDASGALWVGMRHFVLRVSPRGEKPSRQWFAPSKCRRSVMEEYDCVCKP